MAKDRLTFIDLFSGCGGLSLGFAEAGFNGLLAIDFWQDALTTYSHNRQNAITLCADLSYISPVDVKVKYHIPEVDVIIGGPPCQGFQTIAAMISLIAGAF